jgi:hypothetical protein
MVLVADDDEGRSVYESNSPVVRLQTQFISVEVIGRETDELQTVVQAAHNELRWLHERERAVVFAEYR